MSVDNCGGRHNVQALCFELRFRFGRHLAPVSVSNELKGATEFLSYGAVRFPELRVGRRNVDHPYRLACARSHRRFSWDRVTEIPFLGIRLLYDKYPMSTKSPPL